MILRPHPRKQDLGAWFDGEGMDRVGAHVLGCSRCQRHTSELSRLRSWLRAQPFVAMGEPDAAAAVPTTPARRPFVLVAVLLVTFLLVADRGEVPGRMQAAPPTTTTGPATDSSDPSAGAGSASQQPGSSELAAPETAPSTAAPENSVSSQALARARRPSPSPPLRLGLIVPASGSMAAEGKDVAAVVRQRVAAANTAGGVAGLPVELQVAAAEDAEAVAALAKRVDVLVGGFGAAAPTGVLWLLPADPSIAGPSVIPAEMTSRLVGAQLGTVLRRQGLTGLVGVVVGSGPDAGLGAGLATKTTTTSVVAQEDGTCAPEIVALRRAGAVALAVAGSPDLAAKCLRAAFAVAWLPSFGVVLAPSAAYAGLQGMPEAIGARTVLGLPWPTSTAPGAARFRSTTESTSYRALVSYAATELAIDVARQQGSVSLASVEAGNWRTDLVDMAGLTNRVSTLVAAFVGTWLIAG